MTPRYVAIEGPIGVGAANVTKTSKGRRQAWAILLKKTFEHDVLACPGCGGQCRVLAAVTAPAAIARILNHLRLPTEPPRFHKVRAPPKEAQLNFDGFDAA